MSIKVSPLGNLDPEVLLFLHSPDYREVFLTLSRDVIAFSAAESSALAATAAVFRRLDHWQDLLSKGPLQEMGPHEIRGLIGELLVLIRLAQSTGISFALSAWVAPDEHPQDFALATWLLEIKTRLAGSRQQVQISSLEQLEADELPIYLLTIELAPSEASASYSLNDVVHNMLKVAAADGLNTKDKAERLLLRRGYVKKEAYGVDRYVVSGERAFLVGEGFPRIVRSTTDRRIQQATYVLDLTALGSFERACGEVFG